MINSGISPYNLSSFMSLLGNLQNKIPNIVHIAGTNGKGSTTTLLRVLLETHGYSVNTFTSPHMISYNERFRIFGKIISNNLLNDLQQQLSKIPEFAKLSMFEAATAIFFLASSQFKADFTIIETGLGGRLDATNIINNNKLVVLTTIGLDHQRFLGNSLNDIAFEKASIINDKSIVISGYQKENVLNVFKNMSNLHKVSFFHGGKDYIVNIDEGKNHCRFDDFCYDLNKISLLGEHQLFNASLAIYSASKLIKLDKKKVNKALFKAKWPGRLQKIDNLYGSSLVCPLYLDGAHNDIAFLVLKDFISKTIKNKSKIYMGLGMLKNKDLIEFLNTFDSLKENLILYPCNIQNHESFSKEEIYDLAKKHKFTSYVLSDIQEILSDISKNAHNDDLAIITGSLYLIGSILKDNNYKID